MAGKICPTMSRIHGEERLLAIPCEGSNCAMWIERDGIAACGGTNAPLEIRMDQITISLDKVAETLDKMVDQNDKIIKLYEKIVEILPDLRPRQY